ncbi:MAG: hypothetical protein WC457_02200 [Patescibacteria group bacterium]
MKNNKKHRSAKPAAIIFVLLLALGAITSGCVARTAVVSSENHAYVVKGSYFGTDMLFCRATDGKPKCRPVAEVTR